MIYWYIQLNDHQPQSNKKELSPEEQQRRDRRTPQLAIRRYVESSFHHLFYSWFDQALLNCCVGVDHNVFRDLLAIFAPVSNKYTIGLIRTFRLLKSLVIPVESPRKRGGRLVQSVLLDWCHICSGLEDLLLDNWPWHWPCHPQ